MVLEAGTKLGPYEILSLIGKGGMGEVYRAHDTRLGRDVAIKVSQERFSERFDREARAVAALNHPNICALYDVGPNYLVMEFIEGESPQGPLPLDEALGLAGQIAEALAEAHEKGIVHRDLKPGNIKIKPDGTVKVLDFGLAKVTPAEARATPEDSPTLSMAATLAGVILGTAAYMSPEQARGKPVDSRTDIWAFGVVLYELLTGQRLFKGEDLTETLASVVKEQPDLGGAPRRVRRLLETCLQKDPRKRLRAIGDWRLLLEEAIGLSAPSRSRFSVAAYVLAGVATVAAVALAVVHFRETPPVARSLRLSVPLPENSSAGFLELSPDGRRLLLGLIRDGSAQLYLRALDSDELQLLSGTKGARTPFWSPDSRFIGFFADGTLKVIPAVGGPTQVLCQGTGGGGGGTWNRDGVILFGSENGPLRRVNAKGRGECAAVSKDSDARGAYPIFLPDGTHFLYVGEIRGERASQGVYLATLDEPVGRKVLSDPSSVVFTPPANAGALAHLLFLRETTLMAQPFDDATLQPVGDPFPVVGRASTTLNVPQVAASATADGKLVYLAGRSRGSQLTWMDRTGKELGKVGPPASQGSVKMAPDDSMVAIQRRDEGGTTVLWLYDLNSGSESRLTPPGSQGGGNAQWSADSTLVWFGMTGPEGAGLYQKDLKDGPVQFVRKREIGEEVRTRSDLSRDGRFLIYTGTDPKTRADIWYVPVQPGTLNETGAPVKLVATDGVDSQGQLSPDGKWLAYCSTESGTAQVYVRAFPGGTTRRVPGPELAREPRWRGNSKELYFISGPGLGSISVMAVTIDPDGRGGLGFGTPQKLFDTHAFTIVPQSNAWSFSPDRDGKRFLVNVMSEFSEPTVNVISNWHTAVAGK